MTCEDGTVHLIGDGDISRGRVQYCHEGGWYSVCASDIGLEEARAICTTLGYHRGPFGKTFISVYYNIMVTYLWYLVTSDFVGGLNPLLPLQIQCESDHENVKSCQMLAKNISQCSNAAGVICDGKLQCLVGITAV